MHMGDVRRIFPPSPGSNPGTPANHFSCLRRARSLTDLRHLRPECRAQIVEMIGSGVADLRKRSATKVHISVDFPIVCVDSVGATPESPRWLRAEPQAFPRWPGHR